VYPAVYSYLKQEKKVGMETNLYATSSTEGELVWTCFTDCFNPTSEGKTIEQLVKVAARQIRSEVVR
jgi:hypothetical protein